MSKLLYIVLFLVLVLGIALGGGYVYGKDQEDHLALKLNLEELATKEHTKILDLKGTVSAELGILAPEITGVATEVVQPQDVEKRIYIDVDNDTVTISADGQDDVVMTVAEYDAGVNFLSNTDLWGEEVDAENYTVEDATYNGKDAWKYTFESQALTDMFMEIFKGQTTVELMAGNVDPGVTLSNFDYNYEGQFTFVFYIYKDDYKGVAADVIAQDDVVLTFDASGETIDALAAAAAQSAGVEAPEAGETVVSQTYTFKDYKSSLEIIDFELEDSLISADNPLTLLLVSWLM